MAAALTSGFLVLLTLTLICHVGGYTDPVLSPTTVIDKHGNTAKGDSTIAWVEIPVGTPYIGVSKMEDNMMVGGFLDMVRGFTHILQPKDPPYEIISDLVGGAKQIGEVAKDLAFYFAGFAICLILGIFFMIVMPIVCCCFCCCRMCGKCGGKSMQPYPDKKMKCRCLTFTMILFAITATMITGAAMVYLMDNRMGSAVTHMGNATANNIDDLGTYMTNIVEELEYLAVDGFSFAGDVVKRDLDNIGALLGMAVKYEFGVNSGVNQAVQSIIDMDAAMDISADDMDAVNATQYSFEDLLDNVNSLLTAVDTELTKIKTDGGCTATCQAINQSFLTAGVDKNDLPDITSNIILIKSLQAKDLAQSAKDGKKDFDEVPEKISNDTKQNVIDMKQMIDDFAVTAADALAGMDAIKDGKDMIKDQTATVTTYTDMLADYDAFRSYGFLGLAAFLAFIDLFFLLGLILGCCGFKSDVKPTNRSGVSNCGGLCLMAGAGFCFIFSWMLMLLVTLPFLIGGPLDRFLCEPFMDPEFKIFKEFLDKPDGPLGKGYFLSGMLLQDNTIPLTISGILSDCQNDTAAYKAMRLDKLFDLSTMTDYKKSIDIDKELQNLNSDMSGTEIMSDETKLILLDFKSAVTIDYNAYYTELANAIGGPDFKLLATEIRAVAADGTNIGAVNAKLNTQADALDDIAGNHVPDAEDWKDQLVDDVTTMETSSVKVPSSIDKVIADTQTTEDFIQSNGSWIVQQKAAEYGDRVLGVMDQYVNYTLNAINTNVGGCLPLWNVWESLFHEAICNNFILTLNGFWFSLGWCVFFMIPAIIFGVKLAKYLRKMKHLDDEVSSTPVMPFERNNKVSPDPGHPVVISSPPPSYSSQDKFPNPMFAANETW